MYICKHCGNSQGRRWKFCGGCGEKAIKHQDQWDKISLNLAKTLEADSNEPFNTKYLAIWSRMLQAYEAGRRDAFRKANKISDLSHLGLVESGHVDPNKFVN